MTHLNMAEQPEAACAQSPTAPRLRCAILTKLDDLDSLAPDWQRLWASDARRQIFQHFDWIRSWLSAYGETARLFTPAVFARERLAGILPLVLEGRCIRFIGHSVSDYHTVLCDPECGDAVLETAFEALFERSGEWDRMVLENIPEESLLYEMAGRLPARFQSRMITVPGAPCPALVMGERKTEILDALLAKDNFKRKVKNIRRLGEIGFRHLDNFDEVRQHLPEFFRQHIRRWAMDGFRSAFLDPAYVRFWKAIVNKFDPAEAMRFSILEVNGKPAACHFGFQLDGRYLFYKPTFDVDLWDYSPGQILLSRLFEYFKTADTREFDYSQGGETYKFRFSNVTRRNFGLHVFAPGVRGTAARTRLGISQTIKAAVRQSPRLKGVERLAQAWDGFQSAIAVQGLRKFASRRFQAVLSRSEVCVYSARGKASAIRPDLTMRPATLAELADRFTQDPAWLPSDLQNARERIKNGETPHLFYRGKEPVCLAWVAQRNDIRLTGLRDPIVLPDPVLVVQDCRVHPKLASREIAAQAFPKLMEAAAGQGLEIRFCATDKQLHPDLAAALGLVLTHRFVLTRICGWTGGNLTRTSA